jgi:hypothetical protein
MLKKLGEEKTLPKCVPTSRSGVTAKEVQSMVFLGEY